MRIINVIIIIAVCLFLIVTTKLLIDLKLAQNETQPILEGIGVSTVETRAPETVNDAVKKEDYNPIVLGKSTYKDNPLKISYVRNGEVLAERSWDADYIQISGLKDKQIESKINQYLISNSVNDEEALGSFSNVLSIGNESESKDNKNSYNISLVDGRELTIDDYFYDKEQLKNVLKKFVVVAIDDYFVIGQFEEYLAHDFETSNDEERNNKIGRTKEWIKEELAKFNSQSEDWPLVIIQKYDKGDFRFSFNNKSLSLYFDNLHFKNPMELRDDNFYLRSLTKELTKLRVDIPLYEIYPYVSIFDKFANAQGIFENEDDVKPKLICLEDFELIKDKCWCASYDIEERVAYLTKAQGADEGKLRENYKTWQERFSKALNQDKMIIGYNHVTATMSRGPFVIQFYLTADKNLSKAEEADILKSIAKALDIPMLYNSYIIDNLRKAGDELKTKYKDVDYFLEDKNIER